MRDNRATAKTFDPEFEQDDPSFQWPPPEDDAVVEARAVDQVLESEFAADEPEERATSQYRRGRTIRRHALPLAFGVVLMLAVGETVYIIRTSMSGSRTGPVSVPTAVSPSSEPARPVMPESPPAPTPAARPTEKTSTVAPAKSDDARPADDGRGFLTIDSPVELDVYRGQRLVGRSRSRLTLPPGVHTLVLVNDGLRYKRTHRVRVEARRTSRLNIALPESTVHLNAQPWAEVWIDGKPAGETPLGNLSLPIGTHAIVFRHPELGERTVSTVVRAGSPTRVSVDLRK